MEWAATLWYVVTMQTQGPAIALLDVDGTLYPRSIGLALLAAMMDRRLGRADDIARVLETVHTFKSGEICFTDMVRITSAAYAAALTDVATEELEALARDIWAQLRDDLFPFVRPLVASLQGADIIPYIVSSSPHEIVRLLAQDLGVDEYQGSRFGRQGERYTGECHLMPGAPGGKLGLLQTLARDRGAELSRCLALGNGEGDFEVLAQVGTPLLFEAPAPLQAHGLAHGWTLVDRHTLPAAIDRWLSH